MYQLHVHALLLPNTFQVLQKNVQTTTKLYREVTVYVHVYMYKFVLCACFVRINNFHVTLTFYTCCCITV